MSLGERPPTEEEQVVLDLIASGVCRFDLAETLGIGREAFRHWQMSDRDRNWMVLRAGVEYERKVREGKTEEIRGTSEAILRFKQRVVQDAIDELIKDSQRDSDD